MRIVAVVGARPNFMKVAPLARAFAGSPLDFKIVHTGQHYDQAMSQSFFDELDIPHPDLNLGVGSGSHALQTAEIMKRFEPACLELKPDWVLVVGDVNSTAACSLVASKLGIGVCHVEAGLRSWDRSMPEEINRLVTDVISDLLLTTCDEADRNLLAEGIPAEKIHMVGNTMIDTLAHMLPKAAQRGMPARFDQHPGGYGVVTLHRPSNVDNPAILADLLGTLEIVQRELPLIFAIHPRTRKNITACGLEGRLAAMDNLQLCDPLSYLDFLDLYRQSRLVLTDSGGIQEETSWLRVPCITLRENTERAVTVELGTNYLTGVGRAQVLAAFQDVMSGKGKTGSQIPLWDGQTAKRICQLFEDLDSRRAG
ncbi:MAG: UDP-N-acetylglucosamine 2-epimerase (non-hydrolyzing) [Candidatus Delongbacteria bacterium]